MATVDCALWTCTTCLAEAEDEPVACPRCGSREWLGVRVIGTRFGIEIVPRVREVEGPGE